MSVRDRFFLERDKALLVVIDVQEKLCVAMDEKVLRQLTKHICILLEMAGELNVPVLITEQYVKGLGPTLPELAEKAAGAPCFEKMAFSSCGCTEFVDKLKATGRTQIIITGMETHVCVMQTVLPLLASGQQVHVCWDAVSGRGEEYRKHALERMAAEGATLTNHESVAFEWARDKNHPQFKALSALMKEGQP